MNEVKILTESELRRAVKLDTAAVDCIESAFTTLSQGHVIMPPILSMPIEEHNGEVAVKTAYVPGLEAFAIKMSPGFFDNPKLGLPSTSGLMVLFSSRTGFVEAVLLDNGYLTAVRTAAAGAVAARWLSRSDSERACVVGAGLQARLQLEALCLVRPIKAATICARRPAQAQEAAAELRKGLDIAIDANTDVEAAVRSADIVVTTTPSAEPIVMAAWLGAGQHVTAVGSDQAHKLELEPECLARADRYVPDRQSQTAKLGELHHALEKGLIDPDDRFPELGDIVSGVAPGRATADSLTICDLTGTGLQDTAIANFARQRAEELGIGTGLEA